MRHYALVQRYPTQQQQQQQGSGAEDSSESRQDLVAMTRLESVKDRPSVVSFHGSLYIYKSRKSSGILHSR